jgi:hypothetical protein
MAVVNRLTTLIRTPAVTLERFDHEPGVSHPDPDRELAEGFGVNFVETGAFFVEAGRERRRRLTAFEGADQARLEALAGAIYFALGPGSDQTFPFRAERFSWYASCVDRAKELIDVSYAEPLSLSAIAREVVTPSAARHSQ